MSLPRDYDTDELDLGREPDGPEGRDRRDADERTVATDPYGDPYPTGSRSEDDREVSFWLGRERPSRPAPAARPGVSSRRDHAPRDAGPPSAAELSRGVLARWWVVVVGVVLMALAAGAISVALPAEHRATATYVARLPNTSADTESIVRTVQAIITSQVVLNDVARQSGSGLGPRQLRDRIEIERPPGSAVIEVSFADTARRRTAAVIGALTPSVNARLATIQRARGRGADAPVALRIDELGPTQLTFEPVPAQRNVMLGGIVGLGLGLLAALGLSARALRRERW